MFLLQSFTRILLVPWHVLSLHFFIPPIISCIVILLRFLSNVLHQTNSGGLFIGNGATATLESCTIANNAAVVSAPRFCHPSSSSNLSIPPPNFKLFIPLIITCLLLAFFARSVLWRWAVCLPRNDHDGILFVHGEYDQRELFSCNPEMDSSSSSSLLKLFYINTTRLLL
jgi:hypothetical protein